MKFENLEDRSLLSVNVPFTGPYNVTGSGSGASDDIYFIDGNGDGISDLAYPDGVGGVLGYVPLIVDGELNPAAVDVKFLEHGESMRFVYIGDGGVAYSDPSGDDFFDFNGDGLEDHIIMNDWEDWRLLIASTELSPADFNSDGSVDFADFLVLSENFGLGQLGDDTPLSQGDANRDGQVNFADFLILSREFES